MTSSSVNDQLALLMDQISKLQSSQTKFVREETKTPIHEEAKQPTKTFIHEEVNPPSRSSSSSKSKSPKKIKKKTQKS
jgi:hypothetical protein